ncbi:MAG: hypothetical protein M1818_003958 [Claussenomyces sp. TS43310]|nr:MAG: hypothetical protein M1818_003958 [Claussenomyces sp. TS43310]
MAAAATQNPAARPESKSAKKKKAKVETPTEPTASPSAPAAEVAPSTGAPESSNDDTSYESPYIKELYKSIRNVNKKIANASKVDNILAENPSKSLDELVAARKINADQKAQILKKPTLQASLTQLEEQIAQYKKFDQEYKARSQAEKAEFEKALTDKSEKDLSNAIAAAQAEAAAAAMKNQHDDLLLLSQFLRLAAARRADDEADPEKDENMALEGVLLQVYSGDETAVATMIKLINGTEESTYSTTGDKLTTTYAQVKAAAEAHAPAEIPAGNVAEESYASPAVETAEYPTQSDPTIAHAGLTELDEPHAVSMTNGHGEGGAEAAAAGIPQNSGIDEGASNNAAESHWDTNNDLSTSQEWVNVNVPRDITETDTGFIATPAAGLNKQSWADEQPESPTPAINGNDGFHEVQRSRGGRDRDNQHRGRGGRGDGNYRGRGGARGNEGGYRGRGRGGTRGGGGARPRRAEES